MRLFNKKKAEEPVIYDERPDEGQLPASSQFELTRVDRYEIVAPIGSGGMGTVYKAIDRERDLTVAIKVLDRRYDLDRQRRKRDYLGREIMIAAGLNHASIVKYYPEVIEQEDINGNIRRCLLMEYVDGSDLRRHIRERDLTFSEMLDICRKLCIGLDFLHQNRVVHRDIKPENFMLTRDKKHVKIVDFGLSKANTNWRTRWMKEGGGTRKYMSPEQLKKKSIDARSDIFSYGLTMYELFTGKHPCDATDPHELVRQLLSSKYRFEAPSKRSSDIPSQLDKIILKALRRRADNRYQSVTEIILDLNRIGESRI